ncbi:MAG: DUF2953 domain-containing protein [Flavonifractor plautii]
MKAILILGAVLLALGALLRLVRLGALAEYSAAGLRLKLKVGPLRLMLYPRKPKQPRRKAGKSSRREKKREERPQPELGGGPLALVKRFLPLIAEAAGRFRRKLRMMCSSLKLPRRRRPAAAALCFGGVNAFIGMIWPLVEQNFNVKERRLRTRVDFDAERPSVYLYAAATLTAGQALALGLRLTTRFLAEFSKYRAEAGSPATSKQKEAV